MLLLLLLLLLLLSLLVFSLWWKSVKEETMTEYQDSGGRFIDRCYIMQL